MHGGSLRDLWLAGDSWARCPILGRLSVRFPDITEPGPSHLRADRSLEAFGATSTKAQFITRRDGVTRVAHLTRHIDIIELAIALTCRGSVAP